MRKLVAIWLTTLLAFSAMLAYASIPALADDEPEEVELAELLEEFQEEFDEIMEEFEEAQSETLEDPVSVSGTWSVASTEILEFIFVSADVLIFVVQGTNVFAGTFTGSYLFASTVLITAAGVSFHGIATFTGTVAGIPGTAEIAVAGTFQGVSAETVNIILEGTGGLDDLEGHRTLVGPNLLSGTYSGQISFDD